MDPQTTSFQAGGKLDCEKTSLNFFGDGDCCEIRYRVATKEVRQMSRRCQIEQQGGTFPRQMTATRPWSCQAPLSYKPTARSRRHALGRGRRRRCGKRPDEEDNGEGCRGEATTEGHKGKLQEAPGNALDEAALELSKNTVQSSVLRYAALAGVRHCS